MGNIFIDLWNKERHLQDENFYKICCGCHVKKAVIVIAIIEILIALLDLLEFSIESVIFSVINVVLGLLIIYATYKRKPWAYLPYLAFNGLCILIFFFVVIWALVLLVIGSKMGLLKETGVPEPENARLDDVLWILAATILEGFSVWFFTIVYRAYLYVKEVNAGFLPMTA